MAYHPKRSGARKVRKPASAAAKAYTVQRSAAAHNLGDQTKYDDGEAEPLQPVARDQRSESGAVPAKYGLEGRGDGPVPDTRAAYLSSHRNDGAVSQ